MNRRLLTLFVRAYLGILLILNGPVNAIAFGLPLLRSDAKVESKPESKHKQQCKCTGCAAKAKPQQHSQENDRKDSGNNSRPSCPLCPSCPDFPGGCSMNCPCKTPCSLPLVFGVTESAELFWRLADDNIVFSDSHPYEPFLPPRL